MFESESKEKITTGLPKGFVVIFPLLSNESRVRNKITLDELKGCWNWVSIPEGLENIVMNKTSVDDQLREYEVTAHYTRVIGTSRAPVRHDFKIVQQRGDCAIALGCPSFLAKVVAALFAQAVYNDPGGFQVKRFGKNEFEKFWEYTLRRGGTPREIHLRYIYGKRVSILSCYRRRYFRCRRDRQSSKPHKKG